MEDSGGLYSVHWFRIVLDEAHTIKSPKSQISLAAADLAADSRWCLTGTPIQVILLLIFSLLAFDLSGLKFYSLFDEAKIMSEV